MKNIFFYKTKIGKIGLAEDKGRITDLLFLADRFSGAAIKKETISLKKASRQLKEYLSGERRNFSLPLAPAGTKFCRQVWSALSAIPYGQTRSYRDIAKILGNKKATRAVGHANNLNPLPIFIPCHRVIGIDGKLVGYGGGLKIKKFLLGLEKNLKNK